MNKVQWGKKLTCHKCGAKYYDLKKKSPLCPKCGVEYKEEKVKTRRSSTAAEPAVKETKVPDLSAEEEAILDVELDDDLIESDVGDNDDDTIIEDTSDIGGDDNDIGEVIGSAPAADEKE